MMFNLIQTRMRFTIGRNHAINTEIAIMKLFTKITTINIIRTIFIRSQETLIHPIPDKCTLDTWIFIYRIPILEDVSVTISHGMRIFTKNYRAFGIFIMKLDHKVHRWIHISDDIIMIRQRSIPWLFAFIMDQS